MKIYAIRIGESTENYTKNVAYACTNVYSGMIEILDNTGSLIQHDFPDLDFMFVFNPIFGVIPTYSDHIIE